MAGPITPEQLGAHPALQQFVEYIEGHTGAPVDLSRIRMTTHREAIPGEPSNNLPNDGIVELDYFVNSQNQIGVSNPLFYARINATTQSMELRHGWITPKKERGVILEDRWALENLPTPIQGACTLVKELGGEAEKKAACVDYPQAGKAASGLFLFLGWDLTFTLFRTKMYRTYGRFPLSQWTIKNLSPTGAQTIGASSRFVQATPLLAGAGAMFGSQAMLDHTLGWGPDFYSHERFAIGTAAGFGAQRTMQHWMTGKGIGGTSRLATTSFGAGILSAGLVDALIGDYFAGDAATRESIRSSAFFLPAVYRAMMGSRTLALASNYPRLAAGGKIAARVATVGFVADAGLMGYEHLTESDAETARQNRLHRRAEQLRRDSQSGFSNVWRDALRIFMPAFTERHTIPEEFLDTARREMEDTAVGFSTGASHILRHQLIFGNAADNRNVEFYQKVDWNFLREENKLGVIKKGKGKSDWYLDSVAKDLADPVVRYKYLENKDPEQQIRFLQDRYRWDLSVSDVHEILGRIALHRARQDLARIHTYSTPEQNTWAKMFDESGKLNTGEETNLRIHLFSSTGQIPSEEQILALRKVALLVNVRLLRERHRALEAASEEPWVDSKVQETRQEMKNWENLAVKLGLIGPDGKFTPGEIGEQAMRVNPSGFFKDY